MAAELSTILDGIQLGESPRWHDGRLWFADWAARQILAVDLDGRSEVIASAGAPPISFDWLPDGRMLVVSGAEGTLLVRDRDGSISLYADLTTVAEPPWNDVVVDGRGNAYIGSTGFRFPDEEFSPGVLALVGADRSPVQVAEGVALPNGIAATPDNGTLVLAESYGRRLTAFDIERDGGLGNRRVWADLGAGVPDGICLDADGAAWYGDVPNKCCVRVREGGEVLQRIDLGLSCFACMLGGDDGRTLFMLAAEWRGTTDASPTATGRLLAVTAPAPHAGRP